MNARTGTLQRLAQSLGQHGESAAALRMTRAGLESWSYLELGQYADRLAAGLTAEGLSPGDRGILFAPNSVEWIIACLALLEVGAIPVPVDSQAAQDDLLHIIDDSGAGWVFTTSTSVARLAQANVSPAPRLIFLDERQEQGVLWRDLLTDEPVDRPGVPAGDCAVLFYTSGTTGPPKGVPLSHANLISNLQALLELKIAEPRDRLLLPLPLHHVYPFVVGLLAPFSLGMTVVLPRSLTGVHLLRALGEGEATVMLGVPRLYWALFSGIEQAFRARGRLALRFFRTVLSLTVLLQRLPLHVGHWLFRGLRQRVAPQLRLLLSGGAALDPDLARKLEALGWRIASGYGLTETSPILTFHLPDDPRIDNAGQPLPGVRLQTVRTEPQFHSAEVLVKGANVFSGYRNLPEKTAEAFTDDGWFRTGDLGYLDRRGDLHVVGRRSSMIVLPGGENVDPEKVEERLASCPSVREAGVLAPEGRLIGVIVPESKRTPEQDAVALERRLRDEIVQVGQGAPSYEQLSDIVLLRFPLPRTRLGKLRRHKLIERYEQVKKSGKLASRPGLVPPRLLAPEDRQLIEDPVAAELWHWLGERFTGYPVTPDSHLGLDLHVDSLEWLNLTLEIRNRIGVELSDEAVGRVASVRDLLREGVAADEAIGAEVGAIERLAEPESLLSEAEARWLEPPGLVLRALGALLARLPRLVMGLLFHLRIDGIHNLPDNQNYVLTPNHCSALDPVVVVAALGHERLRNTYWGGWVGIMFDRPMMRLVSRAMRVFPVEPKRGPLSNLQLAAAALGRASNLVWFPEGRRSPTGELQRFRWGLGLLLQARPVSAVPVWIEGTREALPPGRLWPRASPVSITIGEPVTPSQLEAEGFGGTPQERIVNALQKRVQQLGRSVKVSLGPSLGR